MGGGGAILLAAGYSSRMGRLKPLLPIKGSTVIKRQVAMLRGVADRTIAVNESALGNCKKDGMKGEPFAVLPF